MQRQLAIQNIEQFFRDRGNDLINPIVLDDDGNEIAGAENIFEALSNGGRRLCAGLSADTFGPDQTCTRAQVVTFLKAALD